MKLKHYYNMYYSRLKDEESILSESAFTSILNKLCKIHQKPIMENLDLNSTTPLDVINSKLGPEYDSVVASLYSLGLSDLDYFKYYMLDKLTNGIFIDILLTSVYRHHRHGQFFLFSFNRNSFTSPAPAPSIVVEYRSGANGYIEVPIMVYSNPFNGDMELEDFLSMAVTDPIYLLDPDKNSIYLMEKLFSGASCIPYSQNKIIDIIGLPQPNSNSSYITWYLKDIPNNILLRMTGRKVVKVNSMETGTLVLDGIEISNTKIDISLLTKNIYAI